MQFLLVASGLVSFIWGLGWYWGMGMHVAPDSIPTWKPLTALGMIAAGAAAVVYGFK